MQIKKINRQLLFLLWICFGIAFFSSCNPTVYLTEDEALLAENKIQIKDRKIDESRANLKSELALIYKQVPNKEFMFIPREWYYFRFESAPPTNRFANWIKNNAAEIPTIHDEQKVLSTAESMQNYLRNRKGYYQATVSSSTKVKEQEAFVSYIVHTGNQFKVRNLEYNSKDPELEQIVNEIEANTLIPPGTGLDQIRFNEEKARIVRTLQDKGYARFNSNHVKFQGDTLIDENYKMDVFVNILAPGPDSSHQKYSIGQIRIYTDHLLGTDTTINHTKTIGDVDFYSNKEEFFVAPETLKKRVFIEEGETYVRSKELRTSQSLNNLNTYRFVNLNPSLDERLDSVINYNFLLTPITNKWVEEPSISAYFANVRSNQVDPIDQVDLFLGLNASYNLSSKNLMGNAESFSIGLDGFIEFNLATIYAMGATMENRLRLPRLDDFTRVLWFSNRLKLIPDKTYISLNDNTNTDLSLSLSYTFTASIYGSTSTNFTYGYLYKPNLNVTTNFKPIGVNLLVLNPLENFLDILDANPHLENSFNNRLLTGFFFRDLNYSYNSNVTRSGFKWGLNYYFETSGVEISALNSTFNLLSGNDKIWQLRFSDQNTIEYSKFFKVDFDQHFNQKIIGDHSIAGRIRAGIAVPFGGSVAVPYVRQFAVGGQNSIRGWQIRELGPGGYNINLDPDAKINTLPYQTGDVLLETSLEYRFPLVSYFKGAAFVDAGNVWVLSDEDKRTDSQFSSEFYKQIAVAAGLGLRMDFSYFLLRFDFGYKIRNPFKNENGSYLNYQSFDWRNIRDANLSIGVNLPF